MSKNDKTKTGYGKFDYSGAAKLQPNRTASNIEKDYSGAVNLKPVRPENNNNDVKQDKNENKV